MTTQTNDTELNIQIAYKAVDDLKALRKQFVSADKKLQRAHIAVYSVLASAFDVLVSLKTAEHQKRVLEVFENQLESMTRDRRAKHAIATTSIELKVIRFVCGELKQKRENSYARVLRVAFAENLHEKNVCFVDWLVAAGGVDEVRRSGGKERTDYSELARKAYATSASISDVAPALINLARESEQADTGFCVAIVRKNVDGTFSIVTTVDNASLTKQALARAGKTLSDDQKKIDEVNAARERAHAASKAARQLLGDEAEAQQEAA